MENEEGIYATHCPTCNAALSSDPEVLRYCPYCGSVWDPTQIGRDPSSVLIGRKRSGVAVFLLITNILGCFPVALFNGANAPRGQSAELTSISMGLPLAFGVGLVAILKWRKWGFHLIVCCYLAHVAITISSTQLLNGPPLGSVVRSVLLVTLGLIYLVALLKVRPEIWSRLR